MHELLLTAIHFSVIYIIIFTLFLKNKYIINNSNNKLTNEVLIVSLENKSTKLGTLRSLNHDHAIPDIWRLLEKFFSMN